jgi:hypothetical protein
MNLSLTPTVEYPKLLEPTGIVFIIYITNYTRSPQHCAFFQLFALIMLNTMGRTAEKNRL